MIDLDESLFLESFDSFKRVIVYIIDRQRKEDGLPPLTEDEQTNLFIKMREEHGVHGDPPKVT